MAGTPEKRDRAQGVGDRLLEILAAIVVELRPTQRNVRVALDSNLDRDLGFDSLSRVELILRVERELDVTLPDRALATAETPRDLLRLVLAARPRASRAARIEAKPVVLGRADAVPADTKTLLEVLDWHLEAQADRTHVMLYEPDADTPREISFRALDERSRALAAGIVARGVEPGARVAIMLPTGFDYLASFFAILMAGAVPVPIYPPARPSQLEDHLRRHTGILGSAGAVLLITFTEAKAVGRLLEANVATLRDVVTPGDLDTQSVDFVAHVASPTDLALVQYTSGSTGQPKGVMLTHADLLANIRAMGDAIEASADDVFVSWLPLYHDMGLIGAWLGGMYYAMQVVLMAPFSFLARPWQWLWTIHRHRGTISAAPNFAYELCLSKIPDSEIEGLDLSSWRLAFNGAEPVSPHTIRRFGDRYRAHGLRPEAIGPVYGLAESAVGLAFPPLDRGPIIDRIARDPYEREGRAVPSTAADEHALEFVACGQPLRGYEIRIVDSAGRELAEREIGRLEFRGPSVTSGYLGNAEATRALFDNDWLDSGDLAYVAGGDVYLTSRIKDMIIRGGRNIFPYEVEEAIGNLPAVRKGCVAVFGSADPVERSERLVIVAETRVTDADELETLRRAIEARTQDLIQLEPDVVMLVAPRTVPKTSSGKLRRAACRELFETGELGKAPRATWLQFARLGLAALRPRWRAMRRRTLDLGYAAYVHLVFWLLCIPTWLGVVSAPRRWRWPLMRWSTRTLFRLTRVPLIVDGAEHLPDAGPAVLVANHASYLDGIALIAALPIEFSFVAKGELRKKPIARLFLERIGATFVERFETAQSVADTEQAAGVLRDKRMVLSFPEGTLTRMPGLLGFRMGAFMTAAQVEAPVVPVTIRGSRSILRSGGWFPRRGTLAVLIGPTLAPAGNDWRAALALRDTARSEILRHVGEPDLALERAPIYQGTE